MDTERFADLAELDRRELGVERAGGGRFAVGIDAQGRRLDRHQPELSSTMERIGSPYCCAVANTEHGPPE